MDARSPEPVRAAGGPRRLHDGRTPVRQPLPLLLPWERPPDAPAAPPADAAVMARLGAQLDRFAATLAPREQAALSALLASAGGDTPFAVLAAEPAAAVMQPQEAALYERLAAEPPSVTPGVRPTTVMIMKATRLCNLRCTYCHFWREGPNQIMSFPVLARAIRDALRAPGARHVEFVWHGGEVTLLPIAFYRKALWLQQQFRRPGQTVSNAIQTNGTRLTDEWLDFLARYRFHVGVSLDGPPEVHDRRRVDAAGRPTAARVRAGLERLRAAGVEHGVLMVVDDDIISAGAARVMEYLLELGVDGVGILNVIPENTPAGASPAGAYLPWQRHVEFLSELFRQWWPAHAGRIVLRELADLAGLLLSRPAQTCFFAGDCFGGFFTVEPTGEVSACDKYIDDAAYRFGNLLTANLADVAASAQLAGVRAENAASVERMRDCPWFAVCHGGCPHDRRLSEQRRSGYDEGCCGLAPLLAEMATALRAAGLPAPTARTSTAGGVAPQRRGGEHAVTEARPHTAQGRGR